MKRVKKLFRAEVLGKVLIVIASVILIISSIAPLLLPR